MAFLSQESTPEPIVTSQSIGVAVVGTGFGEKVHIPGLQAHPRTQPVAIYHRDLAKAKAIATGDRAAVLGVVRFCAMRNR